MGLLPATAASAEVDRRHIAKRSSELNATWMRALGMVAGMLWLSTDPALTTYAAPAMEVEAGAANSQHSAERSLSRDEVDKLLAQARSAIAAGNLDQAQALVERAEKAHIRYPLFYFGPTPSSVRHELSSAQTQRGVSGGGVSAAGNSTNPNTSANAPQADGNRPLTVSDPFARRPRALPAPSNSGSMPTSATEDGGRGVMPAIYDQPTDRPDRYVEQVSAGSSTVQNDNLADAPLPPGLRSAADKDSQSAVGKIISGSLEADSPPASNGSSAAAHKAQTLDLLRQARQALAAGNLDLAEAAARQASGLGVPESVFLPNEDKPSVLSWDIQQARSALESQISGATGGTVVPVAATISDPNDRYVQQARVAPERDKTRNVHATTPPPGTSNMRFAELPEPLDLPADASQPLEQSLPSASSSPLSGLDNPAGPSTPHSITTSKATSASKRSIAEPAKGADGGNAAQLLEAGEAALQSRNKQLAATLFGQAYVLRDQLDAAQQQRLQEHLQMLSSGDAPAATKSKSPSSLMDAAAETQQIQARQLSAEVGKKQSEARHIREQDPRQALKLLKEMRQQVVDAKVSDDSRNQLLRRLDITLDETEKYINDHRSEIELDEKNKAVLEEVQRDKEVKLKVQQKIADLVEQFNKLRDEQRFAEMEVVARRLMELAPDDPVAQQVWQTAKFIRREYMNRDLADRKEESYWASMNDVENSAVQNVGDKKEMVYDQKHWSDIANTRKGAGERNERRTERELEIERRLKTPVLLKYENTPLSEVMHGMSELAGVNIHLDPRGLSQEGVNSDTPVTINLSKEISLKSALNLILEPLHLSYVVKDEVLKITSEQLRDGEVYSKVYNVADLVIPIPNFVPNNNIGLQGLINDAHAAMGYGQGGIGMPGPTVLVNDRGPHGQAVAGDNNLLAQHLNSSSTSSPGAPTPSMPIGSGPGGLGAGANADFDSLIDLITSTVASESWAENGGGQAEIRPFPTNLSLVISQTQAVHEQIADLLEQLRRLQDLQVTIEVRFIRLNDSFFEQIGIDFDANINSRTTNLNDLTTPGSFFTPGPNGQKRQTSAVGAQQNTTNPLTFPNFTSDLDVPFVQQSANLATPPFGTPVQVSQFGFAILSDIEAYFLINAAQGDRRTNVLNAPKVTLFNGQQAFVADATSQPFVIGVIPVVGEFAAAQQPVIVVLNEGTLMTIQAVVSDDRRYVRLTVVPFFTQVGDVKEFTFEGTTSSTSSSSTTDNNNDGKNESKSNADASTHQGVTVQLPSFQFVAVVTTVSVPDGGTVLLGGIKRLSEGRNEFGVPLLSKVPYINRLFTNVGIGRETDSLMMMVTPRIIIQEEEEERLGVAQK
jgi:general secretion pathway protein D